MSKIFSKFTGLVLNLFSVIVEVCFILGLVSILLTSHNILVKILVGFILVLILLGIVFQILEVAGNVSVHFKLIPILAKYPKIKAKFKFSKIILSFDSVPVRELSGKYDSEKLIEIVQQLKGLFGIEENLKFVQAYSDHWFSKLVYENKNYAESDQLIKLILTDNPTNEYIQETAKSVCSDYNIRLVKLATERFIVIDYVASNYVKQGNMSDYLVVDVNTHKIIVDTDKADKIRASVKLAENN